MTGYWTRGGAVGSLYALKGNCTRFASQASLCIDPRRGLEIAVSCLWLVHLWSQACGLMGELPSSRRFGFRLPSTHQTTELPLAIAHANDVCTRYFCLCGGPVKPCQGI